MQGAITFWIGDWVRFGEAKKYISSDKYDQAESVTGLERKTLQNAAYLSESISSSRRREELTPAHQGEHIGLERIDGDIVFQTLVNDILEL